MRTHKSQNKRPQEPIVVPRSDDEQDVDQSFASFDLDELDRIVYPECCTVIIDFTENRKCKPKLLS